MTPITISKITQRRFILGKQGLWPGRRWSGESGLVSAIRECGAMQLDPLNVAARSHDIALWGRVQGYRPEMLDEVAYNQRKFFDYGGALFLYPMEELKYWKLHMRRRAEGGRWALYLREHPEVVESVVETLRERGPLGNRDFAGQPVGPGNYRGRKDTALALYALWITGQVMIHHRTSFQRYYDLAERIVPDGLAEPAPDAAAEEHLARNTVDFLGLVRLTTFRANVAGDIWRALPPAEARAWLDRWESSGMVAPVRVEGSKETWYALSSDLPILETLSAGGLPAAWQPLGPSTADEAVFLAPLEIASARGRAKFLFDFEYIWEVYKPVEQRRWGYYTIPILYEDRLVGRLDPRLERASATLRLMGFWLEPDAPSGPSFTAALARGLASFAALCGAARLDLSAIQPPALREQIAQDLPPAWTL